MQCEMRHDCKKPATMIEEKGWIYCEDHGNARREPGRRVRKLRPHELRTLERGDVLRSY